MPNAYIQVPSNINVVRQGLQNLKKKLPDIGRSGLYRAAQRVYVRTGKYPRQVAGAEYKRTYNLRNSRTLTKTERGYTVEINPIGRQGQPYGVFVLGYPWGGGQARYHMNVTGWTPLKQIIDEEVGKLPPEVIAQIDKAAAEEEQRVNASAKY